MKIQNILLKYAQLGDITDKEIDFFIENWASMRYTLQDIITANPNSNLGLAAQLTLNESEKILRDFVGFKEMRIHDKKAFKVRA